MAQSNEEYSQRIPESDSSGGDPDTPHVEARRVHFSTMRCAPGLIWECIQSMPERVKQRIRDIGFGDLLKLKIDKIEDRALVMFLLSCIKDDPLRIEVSRKVLPITKEAVASVFGIPTVGRPLPDITKRQKMDARLELKRKCDELGMKELFDELNMQDNYASLKTTLVPRWVMKHFVLQKPVSRDVPEPDEWAAQCFMMLVFNALLFSTSDDKITGFDYLMCKDLNSLGSYNLSQAVVDDIQLKAKSWRENIENPTPNLKGCTAFLVVYYLDNLLCDAVLALPQTLPRSCVFDSGVFDNIIKLDKKVFNEGLVSYGKLPLNNARAFYPNVHTLEEGQSVGEEEVVLCAAKGGIMAAKGGTKADPISLDPVLAESVASITDERLKASVSESMKNYELVIRNASRIIHKEEKKIKASKLKIEEARTQISNAQKKLSDDVKSATTLTTAPTDEDEAQLTELNETLSSYIKRIRSSEQGTAGGEDSDTSMAASHQDSEEESQSSGTEQVQCDFVAASHQDSEEESQSSGTEQSHSGDPDPSAAQSHSGTEQSHSGHPASFEETDMMTPVKTPRARATRSSKAEIVTGLGQSGSRGVRRDAKKRKKL